MAGESRNVSILIQAKDQASSVLNGFKVAIGTVAAAAAAAAAAMVGLAFAFRAAVDTARAQQVADIQLASALRAAGQNTKEARDEITRLSDELQDLTTIDDRVVKSVSGLLASLGQLHGKELKRATIATLDFAQALGQDAKVAALLVSKAAGGMVSVLSRYGLQIDENIPQSQKFAAVLDLIDAKFGGIAEAMGRTFEAKLVRVGNNLNDAAEQIGDVVVKSTTFNNILDILSGTAKDFQENIKGNAGLMRDFEVALADLTLTAGLAVIAFGQVILTLSQFVAKSGAWIKSAQDLGDRIVFTFGGAPLQSAVDGIKGLTGWLIDYSEQTLETSAETQAFEAAIQSLKDTLKALSGELQAEQDKLREIARLEKIVEEATFGSAASVSALLQLSRLRGSEGIKDIADAIGNIPKVVKPALSALDEALQSIGAKGLVDITQAAKGVKAAFDAAVAAAEEGFGEKKTFKTEEQFDALIARIKAVGEGIRTEGGAIADFLTTTGRIPETIMQSFEAVDDGLTTLAQDMDAVFAGQATAAAQTFTNTIIQGIFEADANFKDMIKGLLKGLAAAILQAIILRAIMAGLTSGGSLFAGGLGQGGGAGGLFSAIGGGLFAGAAGAGVTPVSGSVPEVTRTTPGAVNQFNVGIFPAPDRLEQAAQILEGINELAERHGATVIATEVVS